MLMHTIARPRAGVFPYRSKTFFRHTLAVIGATLLGSVVALLLMAALTHQAARAEELRNPSSSWLEAICVLPLPKRSAVDRPITTLGQRSV